MTTMSSITTKLSKHPIFSWSSRSVSATSESPKTYPEVPSSIPPPEPPVLIIYTLCDDKPTFLHLNLGDDIFVDTSACLCRKSPNSCSRIVLSSKKKKIKLRKLSASEPGPQGLHSWDLALFRIPRHPGYNDIKIVEKKYLCLDFSKMATKTEFRDSLRSLLGYVAMDMLATQIDKSNQRKSRSINSTAIDLDVRTRPTEVETMLNWGWDSGSDSLAM